MLSDGRPNTDSHYRARGSGGEASAPPDVRGVSATSAIVTPAATGTAAAAANANLATATTKHPGSALSSLGEASGVAFLLGNHAKFGLAERCW